MDLKQEIQKYNNAYRSGKPEISDQEYDDLLKSLSEQISPEDFKIFSESLTEYPGDIQHDYIIGSLGKIQRGRDSIRDFLTAELYFAMEKIDGCSVVITYENGKLKQAVSRGNGYSGVNWTRKAENIDLIPPNIGNFSGTLRGELSLTGETYKEFNYKNKRNGTVGIMNSKKPSEKQLESITFIPYQILTSEQTAYQQIKKLSDLGFKIPKTVMFTSRLTDYNIETLLLNFLIECKKTSDYDIDGLVLCSLDTRNENEFLPKNKIAYKINQDAVVTTIQHIEWNVSKNGVLKPVCIVDPVEISGSTVSRVTGDNYATIKEKNIGVGSKIGIIKSGEIIPKIVEVYEHVEPIFPKKCFSCDSDLIVVGRDLMCENEECVDSKIKKLEYFIKNIGIERVSGKSLFNWGIDSIEKLLEFKGEKPSQQTFLKDLETVLFNKPKEEIFSKMSFSGAGETQITKLIEFFGFENMQHKFEKEILWGEFPEGIRQTTIDNIRDSAVKNYSDLMLIISDSRYNPVKKTEVKKEGSLSGKKFILTGTFSAKKAILEEKIKNAGGEIVKTVKPADFLVCAEDSWNKSTKYTQAVKFGTKIINEKELTEILCD